MWCNLYHYAWARLALHSVACRNPWPIPHVRRLVGRMHWDSAYLRRNAPGVSQRRVRLDDLKGLPKVTATATRCRRLTGYDKAPYHTV